jgi:hypothetical protein
MAVSDVVELIRRSMRDNSEEILREAGEDGLNVVEYMQRTVQARLTQRDLHLTLWEEFAVDPDGNSAEVEGALEALTEGDRDLASHLNQLLEEYNTLMVAAGTAWQPPAKEAGQTIVDGLRNDLMTTQSETLTGVTSVGDVVDDLPDGEEQTGDGPRPDGQDADAGQATELASDADRLAQQDALLDMAVAGELDTPVDASLETTAPTAPANAGGDVEEAGRAALGAEDKELSQFEGSGRADLIDVNLDDADLDDSAVDAGREASMLSDDARANLPGGVQGRVAITEGEDIGGDTYLSDRFVPDEDLADDYRPGNLYDASPDDPISYEQSLRPGVVTVGDVEDALEPVRIALEGNVFPGVDPKQVDAQLNALRDELLRGQQADTARTSEILVAIRDSAGGVWDMLWWELADLAEDLPPALQAVLKELGGTR